MTPHLGILDPSPPSDKSNQDLPPARILVYLIIMIFMSEMAAMWIINLLDIHNPVTEALLDGLIMTLLIFPGLYLLHLQPLIRQIRERARAEQNARANEQLLTKVLELLPVGVWILDKQGKIVHGNPASWDIWAGARYLRLEQYEKYLAWWENTGKQLSAKGWGVTRAITRGEVSLEEEIEIKSFDGVRKIVLNSALPLIGGNNQILGAVAVNYDITQRREQQKALIQTNELLEKVFLSIDILIAYLDRDFNFVRVNENYAKSGGYPAEYFIGKNHFELYPNEENQAIFQRVVETGEPYSVLEKPFEYAYSPERGVTYWDWNLQPVMTAGGQVEGLVLSLVDVTERKRAELQLERQNQELRQLTVAEHKLRELAESLVQAMIQLNATLEPDQVLGLTLEQIRKSIPFQGADIILLENGAMRLSGSIGSDLYPDRTLAQEALQSLDNFPILQQVCTTQQPVKIDAVKDHPGWRSSSYLDWVCSYAAVPLIAGGQVMGVINLYRDHTGAFAQEELERLLAFAAPASLSLHNARLYQAESTARQAAETLSAAARALTQTLDLDHVINTLLDHILAVIDSDTAHVTMMEGEGRLAVQAARRNAGRPDVDVFPITPVDAITDSVIQRIKMTRKGLTIPNTLPHLGSDPQVDPRYIHTWLVLPIIASDQIIGLVELGKSGAGVFSPEQTRWAEALVGQAAVAIQNAWLFKQVRSSSERLQSLARKLVEVQESERYHIARELHDEAGQALSSLKISLGRLEQDESCPPHVSRRLLDLKNVVDCVLEDLHRLAVDLRPVALDHLGLVAALEQLALNQSSESLAVRFKAVGLETERLPQDMETSLYRIVQEALTNVVHHAHASNVGILLERSEGAVKLFVEDDGIGFAPDKVEAGDHLGLVGMRERAEMLGGSLSIESSSGSGTSVVIEVPDDDSNLNRR